MTSESKIFKSTWTYSRAENVSPFHLVQTGSGSTQLPIQLLPGAFPRGKNDRGMKNYTLPSSA